MSKSRNTSETLLGIESSASFPHYSSTFMSISIPVTIYLLYLYYYIHKSTNCFFGVVEQGRAFVILVREGDGYKGVKLK